MTKKSERISHTFKKWKLYTVDTTSWYPIAHKYFRKPTKATEEFDKWDHSDWDIAIRSFHIETIITFI